jgi:hypothetical protein
LAASSAWSSNHRNGTIFSMAHLLGGLSGWTAIAARTHRRYPRVGYLGWPLVAVGKFWLEQLTHPDLPSPSRNDRRSEARVEFLATWQVRRPSDDALRLVASYRMPEERSKSRGE